MSSTWLPPLLGKTKIVMTTAKNVTLIAGPKSWIEGNAIAQLDKVAALPHVEHVYGMPGVHPGPGHPIDAVFIVKDWIYPHLIGSDIGCGMSWWKLPNSPGKIKRWADKMKGLETGVSDPEYWLEKHSVEPCGFEHSLGTIGHGNHFAELLVPDGVIDPEAYVRLTQDAPCILLVHSGSRGFGEKILYQHTEVYKDYGLAADSEQAGEYVRAHLHAMKWAKLNRRVIAERIFEMIGSDGEFLNDIAHNFLDARLQSINVSAGVQPKAHISYYHRKGAIPSDQGAVIIPGSRGSHSYIVEPIGENIAKSGSSLSHGAGRKMSRRDARLKFNAERDSIQRLQRTKFNSIVICEDRELLMEEAPEAYKPIDRVIQDLVDHDLVKVIAMMKPIITYKFRRGGHDHHC